jgi:hypothetical protein
LLDHREPALATLHDWHRRHSPGRVWGMPRGAGWSGRGTARVRRH